MEENINVEKIMEEIRREIQQKGYTREELRFADVEVNVKDVDPGERFQKTELLSQHNFINSNYNNPIGFPITGNPVKVFVQKVIRKLTLFVTYPAFQFQNRFNVGVVRFLNQVTHYINENEGLREMIDKQQEEIEMCKKQIACLQEEVKNKLKEDMDVEK